MLGSAAAVAAAPTAVLTLPVTSQVILIGASAGGRYFAYAYVPPGNSNGLWELHRYDVSTSVDTMVGIVAQTDTGSMSADGMHVAFQSYETNPAVSEGTVYVANFDESGTMSLVQVSPTGNEYPGGGLENQYTQPSVDADGSTIAYNHQSREPEVFVWSAASGTSSPQPYTGTPEISPDGSTVGVNTSGGARCASTRPRRDSRLRSSRSVASLGCTGSRPMGPSAWASRTAFHRKPAMRTSTSRPAPPQ